MRLFQTRGSHIPGVGFAQDPECFPTCSRHFWFTSREDRPIADNGSFCRARTPTRTLLTLLNSRPWSTSR